MLTGDYNISFSTTSAAVGGLDSTFANNIGGDSATFFNGTITGGAIGATFTINGTAFSYDPGVGNLLMDIEVANQDLVPNGSGNGYFWADYTGTDTQRNYGLGATGTGSTVGGLVTEFNATTTVPEPSTLAMISRFAAVFGFVRITRRKTRAQ